MTNGCRWRGPEPHHRCEDVCRKGLHGRGQLRQEGVAMGVKGGQEGPVTFGRAGQRGTLVGPGAIRGVFTAHRPSQPWLPGEVGGRASGSGGRQEGRTGTPNPSPREGEGRRQKGSGPHSQRPLLLANPLPSPTSATLSLGPGAASEVTPLLEGDKGAERLLQVRPWGGAGRDLLPSSLSPTPGGWQSRHDGSSLWAGWSGACGSYRRWPLSMGRGQWGTR